MRILLAVKWKRGNGTFKIYENNLGHRGFSHSILFAFSISVLACVLMKWFRAKIEVILLFLFLSILSHGILDAMTSGGLGVGFLTPYSSERFFFRSQAHTSFSHRNQKFFDHERG
ncbi:membrane-bound metal-dependent hydrolase domain protein [Leptospira weilii serovar Topaz str. LT2116]|uniref:Membrane-bound metal-dependent hydrolase domain protein n=1 Tax=Leptospira weilii serovar Topaz str. LT2116 TaxID=1088540 RepID=M3FJW9_9LEPT|nr:membrane-bound metal-dependent hydrolase domain protein [Leptospira weilii serovar Topaz str. LT2116]